MTPDLDGAAGDDSRAAPHHLGTKWLNFCAYVQYPASGLLPIWTATGVPIPEFPLALAFALPVSVFSFAMAYGLHRRRLWAWRANWGVMVFAAIVFLVGRMSHEWTFILLIQVVGVAAWLWLNFVYWTKRRRLFS